LTFSEIKNHIDPRVLALVSKFMNARVDTLYWPHMDMITQSKLFDQINASKPLSVDERIYCPKFLARAVLKSIYMKGCSSILKDLTKQYEKDIGSCTVRWIHKILLILHWGAFNSSASGNAKNS